MSNPMTEFPWSQESLTNAIKAIQHDFELSDKYPDMTVAEQEHRYALERTLFYESLPGGVAQLRRDLKEFQAYLVIMQIMLDAYTPGQVAYQRQLLKEMGFEP
jgi:uncharacterized protein (DUF885 family)